MIAVIRRRRIGRTGSLVTTMRCSVSTPKSCVAGSRSTSARNESPGGYRPARRERRGDVSFTLHGPDDQRCVARVRKRERQLPPRARVLHRAKFKDIFREFGSRALLCRIGRPRVDADAVRYDRRAVAAAVDGDLQRIAQGAVAGSARPG